MLSYNATIPRFRISVYPTLDFYVPLWFTCFNNMLLIFSFVLIYKERFYFLFYISAQFLEYEQTEHEIVRELQHSAEEM